MTKYDELEELFYYLTDKQKFRVICHYVLRLPENRISRIEQVSLARICQSLKEANIKLNKMRNRLDLLNAIQELFRKP